MEIRVVSHMKQQLGVGVILSLLLIIVLPGSARSQVTNYPRLVVDHREITLVPEDTDSLLQQTSVFADDTKLASLLKSNDTLFWEALGPLNSSLQQDDSVSSFAIVQINSSGFHEYLVGLSSDNQSLLWMTELSSGVSADFSEVAVSAVDYFADDGRYWGLCEEILVLPGSCVGMSEPVVWRFQFHLVAESERWVLLLDSAGTILETDSEALPCETCCQGRDVAMILIASVSVASVGLLIWAKVSGRLDV
jgi:hypothetical protein